jgi:glycosyltransferase involved in cell wall biosynthesis
MNVLFQNSIREAVWGGGEKWMLTAGTGLRGRGHVVAYAGRSGSCFLDRCAEGGFPVYPMRIGSDFGLGNILRLRRIYRSRGIDAVIANFNKDVRLAGLAAIGGPVVVARNGLPIVQNNWRYRLTYTKLVRGIVTNTDVIKGRYLSYGWMTDGFIEVIHNGIDVEQSIDFPRAEVLVRHGIPDGKRIVGIFGRLVGQKRHDLFLEVARRILGEMPETAFLIVGEGPLEGDLRRRAAELGIEAKVLFLGFQRETMPLYSICDCVLLTSRSEGLPNAVLEAMLAGRSVVAFDVGGVAELVPDARVGIVVAAGDAGAMAARTLELLRSDAARATIGRAARERVRETFSTEQMTLLLEAWLQRLIMTPALGRKDAP